jgi:hypothetical protein
MSRDADLTAVFISHRRQIHTKTAVAAAALLFLPGTVRAGGNPASFWFLHAPTGESWPVPDPVAWSLENAGQPLSNAPESGW